MKNVLLAGATGYLGKYVSAELVRENYTTRVIVRNKDKFIKSGISVNEIFTAEVTDKESMKDAFGRIDVVISTVGITRQKDNLTYMDVDYQANKHLLELAKENGVKKFIYVSVLQGENLRHTAICDAKEKFVDELKNSGMDYCVIRPSGFFSDMTEFYNMAKKGRVYLFGDGQYKSNPIDGEDLATVCVGAINRIKKEINVGGPEVLTQEEIAKIAFDALRKKSKIIYIPDRVRKFALSAGKYLMPKTSYGPFEFFMNVMAIDMVGKPYGKNNLYSYFKSLGK